MMTNKEALKLAMLWAGKGVHVFPLGPSKKPLGNCHLCVDAPTGHMNTCACAAAGRPCHGFHSATTAPELLAKLFADPKAVCVGIATGASGLVVVDCDTATEGQDGAHHYAQALKERGEKLVKTFTVATPSGGVHYFYASEDADALSPDVSSFPKVDVKTGGSYVVAPGSESKDGTYRRFYGAWPPAQAPQWLVDHLDRPGRLRTSSADVMAPSSSDVKEVSNPDLYLGAAVRNAASAIATAPEGSVYDVIRRKTFSLAPLVKGGSLDLEAVVRELEAAVPSFAAVRTPDVRRCLEDALRKVRAESIEAAAPHDVEEWELETEGDDETPAPLEAAVLAAVIPLNPEPDEPVLEAVENDEGPEDELTRKLASLTTPDHLWQVPHMRHIEMAAEAVGVKREGLFALAANRAALLAGPSVVGRFTEKGDFPLASINALVARSGSGSNVTRRAAEALLPTPEKFLAPRVQTLDEDEVDAYDWGMETISPMTGSALVASMQYEAEVFMDDDDKQKERRTFFVPRVELAYAEGAVLLASLKKSGGSSSLAAPLEPLILDAFVGDALRADLADKSRQAVPAGSYSLAVQAYFQAEIIGEALARTTGLAQRLRLVPIMQPKGDSTLLGAAKKLAYGQDMTDEERAEALKLIPERPAHPGQMPGIVDFLTKTPVTDSSTGEIMKMCPVMRDELLILTAGQENGLGQEDPLITHTAMNLYRTAAQSALLRASHEINEHDWAIARAFARIGYETRGLTLEWAKAHARQEETEDNQKAVRRTRAVENAKAISGGNTAPLVVSVAKKLRDCLHRDGPLTGTQLRDRLTGNDIDEWNDSNGEGGKTGLKNAALKYGVSSGLFTKKGSKYTAA